MQVTDGRTRPTTWERIENGAKQAWKDEKEAWGIRDTIGHVTGAVAGAVAGRKVVTYVGEQLAIRGGAEVIAKAALTGTGVGSLIAWAPDIYTMTRGFYRGYNQYK